MATLGTTVPTFADMVKLLDPNGQSSDIAELLSQSTPLIDMLPWFASNLPTAHRSTIRTSLPGVTRRRVNEPGASTRGSTAQIVDGMTIFETRSTIDKLLVDLAPTPSAKAAVRMDAASSHLEAIGQQVEDDFFYGSVADDDLMFNGLTVRYNDLDGAASDNIINCSDGSLGSNITSIWLLGLGPNKVFGVYPQGSKGGIMHHDDGLRDREDPSDTTQVGGRAMLAYRDIWGWHAGLVVKDWRYAVRICNIDLDDLAGLTGSQLVTAHTTNIVEMMGRAIDRIPNIQACRPVFIMRRQTKIGYNALLRAMALSNIMIPGQANSPNLQDHQGIPIMISDRIRATETAVTT